MTDDVKLHDLVRDQAAALDLIERTMREHHEDLGLPANLCPTCTFWLEQIKGLRRRAKRAGV